MNNHDNKCSKNREKSQGKKGFIPLSPLSLIQNHLRRTIRFTSVNLSVEELLLRTSSL